MQRKRAFSPSSPAPLQGTAIITDPLEIRRLLRRATENGTLSSLKIRGQEGITRARLLETDPTREGLHFGAMAPFAKNAKNLAEDFAEEFVKNFDEQCEAAGSRECLVLIYLTGHSIIGFTAEPIDDERKDRIVFAPPLKLFKIQRRKSFRFTIPAGYDFRIEIESIEQPGVRVTKRLLDLGEGGVGFFVLSPREAGLFRPGMLLRRSVIRIQGQEIQATLLVRKSVRIEDKGPNGGSKIGTQFEKISEADKTFLAQFVYSQTTHLFF